MFVTSKFPVHLLEQHRVGDLANIEARLVHDCDDSLVRLVDQLADDHVVEVVDVLPLDPLPLVLLLLLLQHQLDEQLLQLLVAVVDAELLKTVLPKDLKAVDVKNSNYCGIGDIRLRKYNRLKTTTDQGQQNSFIRFVIFLHLLDCLTSVVEGSMAALT